MEGKGALRLAVASPGVTRNAEILYTGQNREKPLRVEGAYGRKGSAVAAETPLVYSPSLCKRGIVALTLGM